MSSGEEESREAEAERAHHRKSERGSTSDDRNGSRSTQSRRCWRRLETPRLRGSESARCRLGYRRIGHPSRFPRQVAPAIETSSGERGIRLRQKRIPATGRSVRSEPARGSFPLEALAAGGASTNQGHYLFRSPFGPAWPTRPVRLANARSRGARRVIKMLYLPGTCTRRHPRDVGGHAGQSGRMVNLARWFPFWSHCNQE